jgi:hypothetical protein
MSCDDEVNRRPAEALHEGEILLARDAEDAFDALIFERRDE